jgi:phosphatidylglycerophosphate synthase
VNTSSARNIADGLTWVRVFSAIPITLLAVADLRWWVFGVYIAAALTDLLDGLFARRARPARYGGAFDAYADVFFVMMTVIWLVMLFPGFLQRYGLTLVLPLVITQLALFVLRFVYSGLRVPHLPLGRVAMFIFCSLLPTLVVFGDTPWLVVVAFSIAIIAKLQLAWHVHTRESRAPAT